MLNKKQTFVGGVHPDDNKELTKDLPIGVMPDVSDYYIALSQHIGAPATPIVNAGDHVSQGQLIATASGKVSANIFSPVSGNVVGIEKRKNLFSRLADYIHITREGEDKVLLEPLGELTNEKILKRIEEAGIVGLGGAGFPSAFKDTPPRPCDVLVINGAECEPYLNCDNRLMIEKAKEIAKGINYIATAIGITNVIVGIEDNKPRAIEAMKNCGLNVVSLPKKYPQGAEKMLIYATTGRKVPANGGLPSDVGVIVHNVATCYAVYDAVENNEPLYKRVVTVSGNGVDKPQNMWVLSGTPHKDIFDYCGLNEKTVKLISGGAMMGNPLEGVNCVTSKAESGLLALTKEEAKEFEPTACISCGACARACPMNLMPMYIDFYTHAKKTDEAVKYGAMNCMECGSCAFVCPAKRPIVQSVRLTKQKVREAKKK